MTPALIASPRMKPHARRSRTCAFPVDDVRPAAAYPASACGSNIMLTPATRAFVQSPSRNARCAPFTATSAAEQAVSMATHGPKRPRAYEMRPHAKQCPVPVLLYAFLRS
eukprot:1264442-Prymnesium_polylepis.2